MAQLGQKITHLNRLTFSCFKHKSYLTVNLNVKSVKDCTSKPLKAFWIGFF